MKGVWYLTFLLLLWTVLSIEAQSSSYYKRTYYSPIVSPPPTSARYYHHNHAFVPITYSGSDLLTEESKHKELSKKYLKKTTFRPFLSDEDDTSSEHFTSGEYSSESHGAGYNSKENDSREYTIGTQIRVQHPITIPKKSTSSHPKHTIKYGTSSGPYKTSSYSDVNLSAETIDFKPPPSSKKHSHKYTQIYEPDPFHVVPPPKPTAVAAATTSVGYGVYEPEQDDFEEISSSRAKAKLRDRFKGVASKKQIEKYLEDQQKLLDEALKLRLLNNPKFEQYLKSKDHEDHFEEGEYEHDLPIDPPPPPPPTFHRPNFDDNLTYKSNRPRRRPQPSELKRSPKSKPPPSASKPKRRFRSAIVINV